MDQEPVIGIDLGTTNSVVATVQQGQPVVILNRAGSNLTPSVVAIAQTGKRLVGQIARRQAITNAENTAFAVKRLIGRKFSSEQVQEARKTLAYELFDGGHDDVRVRLSGTGFTVPELSAMVLTELKADAEAFFGRPVQRAVITVPAYFNDGQRQATKDAGKIAGLEVLRIINEPTSAALAYGLGRSVQGKVAVFDLGGGTFDISILQMSGDVFEVLATGGDTFLGGEDFDRRVIEWLVFNFAREHDVDLRTDKMALQRLKEAAEKVKCELSAAKEAQINLPFLFSPKAGGTALHLTRSLTREKLEELTADLVERCLATTRETLEDAGLRPSDVREVLLVGGMTRMPKVQEAVKKFFGREPSRGVHPDEVVALGAAVQAHALVEETSNVVLLDVTPHSLGVAVAGGYARPLIAKNTTVPTSATQIFNTSKDHQTTVKSMVLQGASELAGETELLGEFVLSGLRSAPRGEVEIEVTFDISADGIVSVSARDKLTGQQQSITVTASGGLTREELNRILDEQRDYLLEAQSEEEAARKRNDIQTMLEALEGLLPRATVLVAGSDFGKDAIAKAERTIVRARTALSGTDLATLSQVHDDLSRALNMFQGLVAKLGR